jgi:hypothetical protein
MKWLLLASTLVFAYGLMTLPAYAALPDELDPVKVSPQTAKVLFENEWVRVLEAKVPPGGQEPKHRHPPGLTVFLTDIEIESTAFPEGVVSRQQRKSGEVAWGDVRVHAVKNIGKTPVHAILVELKKVDQVRGVFNPDLDPVKVAADTHKLLLENQHVRVIEAKAPPGKLEPKHRHARGVAIYLGDFDVEIKTFPDGKISKAHRKLGTALWHEPTMHEVRNVGKTPIYAIHVELKD